MSQPLVSIGMPVYNGSNYLQEGLTALLSQTYTNLELIISDNASTDSTEAICRDFAARDSRVRYYRNDSNIGSHNNFKRVCELSSGKYFRWAAHDDLCSLDSVEKCVAVMENDPNIMLAYPEDFHIDDHGNPAPMEPVRKINAVQETPSERFHHYIDVDWLQPWTTRIVNPIFGMMRNDVLKRTPIHDDFMGSDRVLIGEMALYGKVLEVPGTYFKRRIHATMSEKAYKNDRQLALAMMPWRKGQVFLPRGLMLRGLLEAVKRVPMSEHERQACYGELSRWFTQYGAARMFKDVFDLVRGS
ncbi:MAG: glycosyltransferase family 2 protein [Chloroflexota bacterium]|nr:glycosyltransferase family 2 protein [Chloroflexota bacterium]